MDTETGDTESQQEPEETESTETEQDSGGGEASTSNDAGDAQPAKKGTHKERRQAWFAERQKEMEGLKGELARERQARQQFEVQMAEMRGRMEAVRQPQADPFESKLTDLRDRANRHLKTAATSKDPTESAAELKAYHEALEQISDVRAERKVAEARQEWTRGQLDENTRAMAADLGSEFKWLRTNVSARKMTDALIEEMLEAGHPPSYETYRAACASVAQFRGLGGTAPRGNGQRYTLPVGSRSDGGEDGDPVMKLQPFQQQIAEKAYPDLDSDAAHRKWWNDIGKKVAKARQQQG